MGQTAKAPRQNRTITVNFQDPSTYFELLSNGKAFVEFVLAFILSIGFQLVHKATCTGSGCLTRHSHYARVRLGGLIIWRIQCTSCKAVFTVLPHFVLRYRRMSPEVARQALIATHGGLSLEWCATICHISPMALYRLICALARIIHQPEKSTGSGDVVVQMNPKTTVSQADDASPISSSGRPGPLSIGRPGAAGRTTSCQPPGADLSCLALEPLGSPST
jgi:hypothetical protein